MKVQQTLAEIEQMLNKVTALDDPLFDMLEHDGRKGVQQLIHKWRKQFEAQRILEEKFLEMNNYEKRYRLEGYHYIAGVDEVGRGPLAGPVVAAAVILPKDFFLPGIDDSKRLTNLKRQEYAEIIKEKAIAVGISFISAEEIDRINIYEATKKAMMSAILSLNPQPDFLLIDAMKLEMPYPSESIIKGDAKSVSIAAASIIAKTTRDNWMMEVAADYPDYGFDRNMGYGTQEHLQAIEKHGITPYHRKSFAPIKEMV